MQALLGVSAVILPGTTVEAGATIGALCSPVAGGRTQAGMIHLGSPCRALLRAAPGTDRGEQPAGAAAIAAAALPAAHATAAAALAVLAAAPAAIAGTAVASILGGVAGAAAASGVYGGALVQLSAAAKAALVGKLQPGTGIRKYSAQNVRRSVSASLEMRAQDLFAECGRGASWWNDALRARGVAVPKDAYIDTAWAGDYELVQYGAGAIVDHGAYIFAHLGLYRGGELRMEQAVTVVGPGAVVGPRAGVLPAACIKEGAAVAAGQLAMKSGI